MKVLAFAASKRKASYNRMILQQAIGILKSQPGVTVDFAEFHEFDMPCYDGDLEETSGMPAGAQELVRRIQAADALVIATPEYNGGIAGPLKNAMDWASRARPMPFAKKHLFLMGASISILPAVRGLWHTRVPFEAVGTFVYPEMFGIAKATENLTEAGEFKSPADRARLEKSLLAFVTHAKSFSS